MTTHRTSHESLAQSEASILAALTGSGEPGLGPGPVDREPGPTLDRSWHQPAPCPPALLLVRELVVEQFGIGAGDIGLDTSLREDLGADSLDLIELVLALEEELGVPLPERAVGHLDRVGDVVRFVEFHLPPDEA